MKFTKSLFVISLFSVVALVRAEKPWKNATEVSVVSTNGNSKSNTTSVKNIFNYNWTKTGLEIGAGGLGSSNSNQVTTEQYFAYEKATWNFTPRFYTYERFGWDKNRFAAISNRWDASTGLGYLLLDAPHDKFKTELGGGYINEERINAPRNDFGSGRAYGKYEHIFSEKAKFTQDAEYLHNFKETKDYRLNTETALIAPISEHISLKASYVWKRVGMPVAGKAKDDTITGVALIANY